MTEFLEFLFSLVCGQNPGHTWMPGGEPLAFCQRCTGLYLGATLGLLLQRACRPRPSSGFLWIHGALLLQMVPQGFHLVPQEAFSRTISGVLFGVGLVAFLLLPIQSARGARGQRFRPAGWGYGAGVLVGTTVVVAGGAAGGQLGALALSCGALAGLLGLASLVLLDTALLLAVALRRRGESA